MKYYLLIKDRFAYSCLPASEFVVINLQADNMTNAKKEALVFLACKQCRVEMPKDINYNNFNEWFLEWALKEKLHDDILDLFDDYSGSIKTFINECYETCIDNDETMEILEVNNVDNVDKQILETNTLLKQDILKKAKDHIQKEEREKLAELRKKYGE